MKILVSSDLHYRLKQFDWLLAKAPEFDAIVIAGDMLDISSHLDLNLQVVVIQKILRSISEQTTLMVCSGNHDGNEKNHADEYIAPWIQELRSEKTIVDGDSFKLNGTLFTIFPWWDGDITKQDVVKQLEEAQKIDKEKWVWIYHAPPDKSLTSWVGKRHIGDIELNQWIEQYQPDLVISGHIHESPFKTDGSWADKIDSTWLLNAGSQIGEVPAHIVVDLGNKEATWQSIAGTEKLQLN